MYTPSSTFIYGVHTLNSMFFPLTPVCLVVFPPGVILVLRNPAGAGGGLASVQSV